MMTPKEKAKELVLDKFRRYVSEKDFFGDNIELTNAKQCAIIAVDEILNEYWSHDTKRRDWWKEVKQEIEKL